ncbi:MAG: LamG-like jellyroll fold domain-containing protein [Acidobacteriota bacterium]
MRNFLHSALWIAVLQPCSAAGQSPSPTDSDWLRQQCVDGALVHHAAGRLYLTELATGVSQFLAPGAQPEFSPDSSKIAWIDGKEAKGRMRRDDETIHTVARGVEASGGVHWLSNDEVAVVLNRHGRRAWYRVSLVGETTELPGLTKLGTGGYECDIRLGRDGIWSYVAKRSWKTSDGRSGKLPGTCSVSLSPDGRSATSLHNPHKEAPLTAIRPGGINSILRWPYLGGFDNHRWSSNDPRYIVAVDEHHQTMAVMTPDGRRVTRLGTLGQAKHGMYGDFTVGDGRGDPWPRATDSAFAEPLTPPWPIAHQGLLFAWQSERSGNTLPDANGATLCRVLPQDEARISRHFAMDLGGGAFTLEPAMDASLAKALAQSEAITVELAITPGARPRRPQPIVTLQAPDGTVVLALEQRYETLVASLRLRAPGADSPSDKPTLVDLFPLPPDQTRHVALTHQPGRFIAYGDGERLVEREWPGVLAHPANQRLVLGARSADTPKAERWRGTVEGLALYDRALSGAEILQQHQAQAARWRNRRPTPRLVVEAELVRQRPIPRPDIYPQTLVVYDYRVSRVDVGAYDNDLLRVAHWGVLNGSIPTALRDRRSGRSYHLVLERFDEHPELQALRIVDDGERFDLPLFHDPGLTP